MSDAVKTAVTLTNDLTNDGVILECGEGGGKIFLSNDEVPQVAKLLFDSGTAYIRRKNLVKQLDAFVKNTRRYAKLDIAVMDAIYLLELLNDD